MVTYYFIQCHRNGTVYQWPFLYETLDQAKAAIRKHTALGETWSTGEFRVWVS